MDELGATAAKVTMRYRPPVRVLVAGLAALALVVGVLLSAADAAQQTGEDLEELDGPVPRQAAGIDSTLDAWTRTQSAVRGIVTAKPEREADYRKASLNHRGEALAAWAQFSSSPPISAEDEAARIQVTETIRRYDDTTAAAVGAGTGSGVPDPLARLAQEESFTHLRDGLVHLRRDVYQAEVRRRQAELAASSHATATRRRWAAVLAAIGGTIAVVLNYTVAARRSQAEARSRYHTDVKAAHNSFDAELQIGLDRSEHESDVLTLAYRATAYVMDGAPSELLLADSSGAHFRRVARTDPDTNTPGCPVTRPADCPAIRHAHLLRWDDSRALDACAHLSDHVTPGSGAVCVPVTITGTCVGVLHAVTPAGQPPSERQAVDLSTAARKIGERLGALRAFALSEVRAGTDHLTGLPNRRSLEQAARDLDRHERPYAVVFVDLDHFKALNDTFGHDIGDRSLRLFARAARARVRPGDVVARYGGEEFVLVLQDCVAPEDCVVLERLRQHLAASLDRSNLPRFTASYGVAFSRPDRPFTDTVAEADANLLEAKARGRDCVVLPGQRFDNKLTTPR